MRNALDALDVDLLETTLISGLRLDLLLALIDLFA